jgi:hypothetical protein
VNIDPFDLFFGAFAFAMFLLTVILSNVIFKQEKKVTLGDNTEETRKYIKDIKRMRTFLFVLFGILIAIYGMYHYSQKFVK